MELKAATAKEKEAARLRGLRKTRESDAEEVDSGDETEGAEEKGRSKEVESKGFLSAGDREGELRKRRSVGEASSGDLSTDGEWDKVEDEGDIGELGQ